MAMAMAPQPAENGYLGFENSENGDIDEDANLSLIASRLQVSPSLCRSRSQKMTSAGPAVRHRRRWHTGKRRASAM